MAASSDRIHEVVAKLSGSVATSLFRRLPDGGTFHIEDIQDQVELALMREGAHKVARRYVLYREERSRAREDTASAGKDEAPAISITLPDGSSEPLNSAQLLACITHACKGLEMVEEKKLFEDTIHNLYDNVPKQDVLKSAVMSAKAMIEAEPEYSMVAARLLLRVCEHESYQKLNIATNVKTFSFCKDRYTNYFEKYITYAVKHQLLAPELAEYDLELLAKELHEDNDFRFNYLGLQTLYDRYFIHHEESRIELPQAFFMRIAMGLALYEKKPDRHKYAIEFYRLLSSFRFMSSTPTLFNSGTPRPSTFQLLLNHHSRRSFRYL